jgi:3-phosphoshikimate 1-carboxyvinyltransferase
VSRAPLEIRPLERPPDATITVPGSKSITNRAVLLAALADGRSELSGALFSDDTRYMVEALRALGVHVETDEAACRIVVDGCGGQWPAAEADLFVGNAGTAMRFLVPALCLRPGGRYTIDGSARMRERPIGELVDALRQLGVDITCSATGTPPVTIRAGGLPGGTAELSAERSSQFLSALMLVMPYAGSELSIRLRGTVIAHPYVDMTHSMMVQWGVVVLRDGYREFRVRGRERYGARSYAVEPDASSAHYFWAAAALTGGRVRVPGLSITHSLQGDVRFAKLLEAMGAGCSEDGNGITVSGPSEPLSGADADLNEISDTAPTLAAIAPFADGPVHIHNVAHLRWQESDRLHAVATELARLGVRVEERDDGLSIWPSPITPASVHTYDDHRIAMAFALIGLKVGGVRIEDPDCVAKTFPDYFERLDGLRR